MTIRFVTLEKPINGKKKILDEESFFSLYINSDKTIREIAQENKVATTLISTSIQYYLTLYPEEIKNKKHKNYHKSSVSPSHVLNVNPPINLNKQELAGLIAEGKSEWEIAKIYSVAPQTIRRNVRKYKLAYPPQGLYRMTEQEWIDLEYVDQFAPGLLQAAYMGINDPSKFFHLLYDAFLSVVKLLWTLQKFGRRYSHYVEKRGLKRDYISWRINKQEIELSQALRRNGIEHIREYAWAKSVGKNFSADFFLEKYNLIIEINGSVHDLVWVLDKDAEKEKLASKLGYDRLVFTTQQIDNDVNEVITTIREQISK